VDLRSLAIGCTDFSPAENRPTSIHASHPIETGSDGSGRESWCALELLKSKAISSPINFDSPYNVNF
jgi:hypothetical protein